MARPVHRNEVEAKEYVFPYFGSWYVIRCECATRLWGQHPLGAGRNARTHLSNVHGVHYMDNDREAVNHKIVETYGCEGK